MNFRSFQWSIFPQWFNGVLVSWLYNFFPLFIIFRQFGLDVMLANTLKGKVELSILTCELLICRVAVYFFQNFPLSSAFFIVLVWTIDRNVYNEYALQWTGNQKQS